MPKNDNVICERRMISGKVQNFNYFSNFRTSEFFTSHPPPTVRERRKFLNHPSQFAGRSLDDSDGQIITPPLYPNPNSNSIKNLPNPNSGVQTS